MANTIAYATGHDSTREKTVHRLGSRASSAKVATWTRSAEVTIYADSSGEFVLRKINGEVLHRFAWAAPNANQQEG